MLVLSRKVGQELVIGDNIRVTVSRVGGNRVTLGIVAPQDVRIMRGELEPIVRSFEVELEIEADERGLSEAHSTSQLGEVPLATPWVDAPSSLAEMPRHIH